MIKQFVKKAGETKEIEIPDDNIGVSYVKYILWGEIK